LMIDAPEGRLDGGTDGYAGVLEYATAAFDESSAVALADDFVRLLRTWTVDPERSVTEATEAAGLSASRALTPRAPTQPASLRERSNLTDRQLRVWTESRLYPQSRAYNIVTQLPLDLELDVGAFRRALDGLARSADTLRARVLDVDGAPRWVFADPDGVGAGDRLEVATVRDQEVEAWIAQWSREPLDPSSQPFATALLQVGPARWIWVWHQHQLFTDEESTARLFSLQATLYRRACAGEACPTIERPSLHAHLEHDARARRSAALAQAERFWRPLVETPSEPLRPYGSTGVKQGLAVRRVVVELGARRSAALRQAIEHVRAATDGELDDAQRRWCLVLLAAWAHRATERRRLVIGVSWRSPSPDADGVIGLLTNVVPVELEVGPATTFADLLDQVASRWSQARAHGTWAVPNPIDRPVFDLALHVRTGSPLRFAGAPVVSRSVPTGEAFESITLHLGDDPGTDSLRVELDVHDDVISPEHEQLLRSHLSSLIDIFCDAPQTALEDTCVEPSRRSTWPVEHATVLDAFDRHVAERPEHPALVGTSTLTYRQLDACARGLAERLVARGVGAEQVVGVDTRDRFAALVAILGILRSGAAYLPLDPQLPPARLSSMRERAGVQLVVADPEHGAALGVSPRQVVDITPTPARDGRALPRPRATSRAYVMFTSGSTGTPKGVEVEHQNLAAYASAAVQTYGFEPRDRVLQFITLSFDVSLMELFGAWTCGATLVVRDEQMLLDPERFVAFCRDKDITILNFPTGYWQQWIGVLAQREIAWPASVRTVLVGGDRLTREAAAAWRDYIGGQGRQIPLIPLINCYGPTEATVYATVHSVAASVADPRHAEIPIGRALGATQTHVVDRRGRPVGPGIVGELWLGGPLVARGYINDPAQTAAKFIPNPFSSRPGERLYRTGDRVRRRLDGVLEFLGRTDGQVKIRGFRVELGEVEAAIRQQPGIRAAAVVASPTPGGESLELVAYIEAQIPEVAEIPALRDALRRELPPFMVPARVHALERMPLDRNGKIDRRSLSPKLARPAADPVALVPPTNALERTIAQIWADALGVEQVSIHANFFEIGGTSLSLLQIHPRLRDEVGCDLPVAELFAHPTVHRLAQRLQRDAAGPQGAAQDRAQRRRAAAARMRRRASNGGTR
ncbi:MAG: amino acid adenylation domain-containing protein, partial [Myxococcota bacterium]